MHIYVHILSYMYISCTYMYISCLISTYHIHTYICICVNALKTEDDEENEEAEEEAAEEAEEIQDENKSEGAADLKQAHELSHELGGETIQFANAPQSQDLEIDSDLDDNLYLWTPDGLFFLRWSFFLIREKKVFFLFDDKKVIFHYLTTTSTCAPWRVSYCPPPQTSTHPCVCVCVFVWACVPPNLH